MMIRLAILTSHSIQYNAPLFRELSLQDGLKIKVFYSWEGTANRKDPEFGEKIAWDIPLLDGYDNILVSNISKDPGTHHYRGLDNPGMIGEIESWNPDALLIYGWAFKTHLNVLRYFKGKVPIFFRGDSTLLNEVPGFRKMLRRFWLRWIYSYVDYAFYVGLNNKEYFLVHGLSEKQLIWAPHSIDNNRFLKDSEKNEEGSKVLQRKLSIPENSLKILFAGKLVLRKDPELLLDAVSEVISEESAKTVHLIVVGEGPLRKQLEHKFSDRFFIHFLGFQNQSIMPVLYRLCDILVLPSQIETWGLAVNEAMACGRGVIVSDKVGCAVDLVRPGVTGEIFRCGDKEDLKAKIRGFVNEPEKSNKTGKSATELISNWSIEKTVQILTHNVIQFCEKKR